MQKIVWLFLILIFCSAVVEAKDPCHYSTEGTNFWFAFMQNRQRGDEHYMEITVSSRSGATFRVTYGPGETLIGDFTVGPNTSETVGINYHLLEPSGSEIIEDKGIHLTASDTVNVYALNYRTQSSDVAVIYPTESLGKEYFAMCYTPNPTASTESNSEFLILATENNTTVTITPPVNTDQGKKANTPFSVTLNRGQIYQVQSMNRVVAGQGDLTGSYISSDKPIAFYSGVLSTSVPETGRTRDHLYEQIPPTTAWGREFYVAPLRNRLRDTYRILAAEDETTVTIEGTSQTRTLKKGEFFEFLIGSSQACRITATRKVLLAQFCRSQEADQNGGVGDPFMIILSPVSQKVNDVTFEAYETSLVRNIFFVNIITLSSEVANIRLDGLNISSFFKNYPDGKYAYAQVPVTAGTHRLRNPDKYGGFLAYVYGFGDNDDTESYGYGVGFNLDIQLEIGGSFSPVNDTILICRGDAITLEAGEYFASYEWSTGETTQNIVASEEGMYRVTATTLAGCRKTDSLFVRVDSPKLYLGNDTTVCLPGELTLTAPEGFNNYLWQDGSASNTFIIDETGSYSLEVTNKNGCKTSDTIFVKVLMPYISFKPDFDTITTDHPIVNFNNETIGNLKYEWNFGDGKYSSEVNPTHQYPDELKIWKVSLKATNEFGCTDSISSKITVVPSTFLVPNAFRPSSDLEENRTFKPTISAVDQAHYQLKIFSRSGAMIYESNHPDKGWTGENAEQGLYVWTVKYLDIQGYPHNQKGTVMLLR